MFPPMAPERPLRADAARNRQALIDAAQRLFTARGLAVTLDDIADEAGVNVATAYRHFAGKQDLAAAFLGQIVEQAVGLASRAAEAPYPWQGLVGFLEGALAMMRANRGLHDVLTPGYASEWLERLDERAEPLLEHLLRRGQRAGVVRRGLRAADL